ncbi:MAG: hypothetical protein V5A51_10295 [Bacteroidales bacterium]
MKTTNHFTDQKKENNYMNHLENYSLQVSQMLLIKGGDANDTDDTSGGSDDQQDGFN